MFNIYLLHEPKHSYDLCTSDAWGDRVVQGWGGGAVPFAHLAGVVGIGCWVEARLFQKSACQFSPSLLSSVTRGRRPGAQNMAALPGCPAGPNAPLELLPGHVCWELEGQEPGGQLSAAGRQELGF